MQRRFHEQSSNFIKHCADLRKNHKEESAKHQADLTKQHEAGMLRIERAGRKFPTASEVKRNER